MLDNLFEDLANRLRSLTGQTAAPNTETAKLSTATLPEIRLPHVNTHRIKRESLLVMQQSLRRHPALQLLFSTQEATLRTLYNAVHDAVLTPVYTLSSQSSNIITNNETDSYNEFNISSPGIDNEEGSVLNMLFKLNQYANNVELERLAAFSNSVEFVKETTHQARKELTETLGFDTMPKLNQNNTSLPCPWNVLFTLQASFKADMIITVESNAWNLCISNATSAVNQCLSDIRNDRYNVIAWRKLLLQLSIDFPLSVVRGLWQAALILFPTSSFIVNEYVQREIEFLRKKPKLWECHEFSEVEIVYLGHLRLLNTFFRHLRITFSSDLYMQFFQFITEFVQADERTLDLLYCNSLREDIGFLPTSTQVWRTYMNWRISQTRDFYQRKELTRQLYKRILQTPLYNLHSIKEMYDKFVDTEPQTRAIAEEKKEIGNMYARANAEANELQQFHEIFGWVKKDFTDMKDNSLPKYYNSSHSCKWPSLLTFLPRPLQETKDELVVPVINEHDMHEADEDRLLMHVLWSNLLDRVKRLHVWGTNTLTLQHYARCRGFYKMRACVFMHHFHFWAEWVYFIIYQQPFLSSDERQSMLYDALILLRRYSCFERCMAVLFSAEIYVTHLSHPDRAFSLIRQQLLNERLNLLSKIRRWQIEVIDADIAINSLETIVMLAINWMRTLSHVRPNMSFWRQKHMQNEERATLEQELSTSMSVNHIAEFVMHKIDLLSLTMAILKRVMQETKGNQSRQIPTFIMRPFNVFCHSWIELVIIRERKNNIAVMILKFWAEHIKLLLRSASERQWSAKECGANDLLLNSCEQIIIADGTLCKEVVSIERNLSEVIQNLTYTDKADKVIEDNAFFIYECTLLQHRYFASVVLEELPLVVKWNECDRELPSKGCTPVRFTTKCDTWSDAWDWDQINAPAIHNAEEKNLINFTYREYEDQDVDVDECRNTPNESSWMIFEGENNAFNSNVINTVKSPAEFTESRVMHRENEFARSHYYATTHREKHRGAYNIISSNKVKFHLFNQSKSNDGVIVESVIFPDLSTWISKLSANKELNSANGRDKLSVDKIEELIYELPTLYEYMYDFPVTKSECTLISNSNSDNNKDMLPSAQWLVEHLQLCGMINLVEKNRNCNENLLISEGKEEGELFFEKEGEQLI